MLKFSRKLSNDKEELLMKNKKKKGFTLVELIAVIAILGILAAIVVPRVTNFTDKAKDTSDKADAKTIVSAIELYNTEVSKNEIIGDSTQLSEIIAGTADNKENTGTISLVTGTTLSDLQAVVTDVTNKKNSTITTTTTVSELRNKLR